MATTLYTPTRVTLGKGAEDSLGDELKRNGAKKVLVHYGSERIVRDGLMKRLTDQMDREGIEYVLLGGGWCNVCKPESVRSHVTSRNRFIWQVLTGQYLE